MQSRLLVFFGCALVLAPQAAADPAPPLMANSFAYEWVDDDSVLLTWQPPTVTDYTEAAVGYNVYVFDDEKPFDIAVVYAPETELPFDLGQAQTYTFTVRAFGASGAEGVPTAPIILKNGVDWPRCTVLGTSLEPPFVEPEPTCLLPLPV